MKQIYLIQDEKYLRDLIVIHIVRKTLDKLCDEAMKENDDGGYLC
jgi:hypothetical protein